MTQPPPPFPPNPNIPNYDGATSAPTNSMAVTSMILGIIGIVTSILGIGLILGIVALILGIIALSTINKKPFANSGKGFAITGIVTGSISLLMLPLLIAILLPSLGKAKELSQRSTCAANVRGIVNSMAIYAKDNNDAYPIVTSSGTVAAVTAVGGGAPNSNPDDVLKSMYVTSPSPSISQNMWILVLGGQVTPRQFTCKSDPSPLTNSQMTDAGANYLQDFNNNGVIPPAPGHLMGTSYSTAFPWTTGATSTIGGWWRDATDASLPLMSDMAPFGGAGSNLTNVLNPANKLSNSPIHQRDGQNIGFGDGHAEFSRRPDIGHSNDNIFSGNGGTPSATAGTPSGVDVTVGKGGSPGNYDVQLVPAANIGSGYQRQ